MKMLGWLALLGPAMLLLIGGFLAPNSEQQFSLLVGAGVLLVVAVVLVGYYRQLPPPAGPVAFINGLGGCGWLWAFAPVQAETATAFRLAIEGILVLVPVAVLALGFLMRSGSFLFRAARRIVEEINKKTDWPPDLALIRELPLVKDFREAITFDPWPALTLLTDNRPQVRQTALAALEYRASWRVGQLEQVLALLQRENLPEVRVGAINAVAASPDRKATEALAEALADPDPRVRQAAADGLFWDGTRRWHWLRNGVRTALMDPKLHDAGPLLREGQILPPDGVQDIIAWAAERGIVSVRAAQTLAVHYVRAMQERPDEIRPQLISMVETQQTPPLLRIHLAKLLFQSRNVDPRLLDKLLNGSNPVPLRQLAAEQTLLQGWNAAAVGCLREIAKLPNRELALDTARIVQQCLHVDLGLAVGHGLPPANSPKAAEVARKLLMWATRPEAESALDTGYKPSISG